MTGPRELPASGFVTARIGMEFGGVDEFRQALDAALARAGERGATLVAVLDRGDLRVHLPGVDGPCWNSVPLFHLQPGDDIGDQDWATTTGVLEKLERYR